MEPLPLDVRQAINPWIIWSEKLKNATLTANSQATEFPLTAAMQGI